MVRSDRQANMTGSPWRIYDLPRIVTDDEEHDRLADVLMHLVIPKRELPPEEEQLVGLIGRLIEDYEERSVAMPEFMPFDRLTHLVQLTI